MVMISIIHFISCPSYFRRLEKLEYLFFVLFKYFFKVSDDLPYVEVAIVDAVSL